MRINVLNWRVNRRSAPQNRGSILPLEALKRRMCNQSPPEVGLLEKAERGKLVCPFDKLRLFHADIGGLCAFKTGGQARKSPVIREGGTDYGHKLLDGRLKCHKRAIEGKYSACLALLLEVVGDVPVQLELNQSCM